MNKLAFLSAVSLIATAAIAQTTVYPLVNPRANYTVVAGSEVGAPSQRYWGATATDGTRMFVFGGRNAPAGTAGSVYYNGLYAYDAVANTWTTLSPENDVNAPSVGFRESMAYDPILNRLVIFGGLSNATAGVYISTCHVFDLTTNTWSQIPNPTPGVTGPLETDGGHMAYDATSGSLVLFGGTNNGGVRTDATWLLSGTTWTQVTGLVSGVTVPLPRNIHGMASRSAPYNDVIVVGGTAATGPATTVNSTETWRWDGATSTWSLITPINSTLPVSWVSGNELVYDSVRQVLVINNGTGTGIAPSNTTSGSTGWVSEYDCVTNEWRAFGVSTTTQATSNPIIGNLQRFYSAFVNGKVLIWAGQNTNTIGDADLSRIKTYQTSAFASATSYGTGCGGLNLAAGSNPWGGRNWTLSASGYSGTAIGAILISLAQTSAPLPAPGQLGCDLLVDNNLVLITTLLFPTAGQADFTAAMPLNPAFAGLPMNSQAFALDAGLVTSSNGIAGVLGAN